MISMGVHRTDRRRRARLQPWTAVTPSNRAGRHRAARRGRRWADPAGRRHTEDRGGRDSCMMPPPHLAPARPAPGLPAPCRPGLLLLPPAGLPRDRRHREPGTPAAAPQWLAGEKADELIFRLTRESGLSQDERTTARRLIDEEGGIRLLRSPGQPRWSYEEGRHRACALMDAGVRRILVTISDDRRSPGE